MRTQKTCLAAAIALALFPALAEAHPEAYAGMGLKDLCDAIHKIYKDDKVPQAQRDIYTVLPEITVCYRCQAHFRGFRRNPAHQAFDLHVAEQYGPRRDAS